MTNTKTFTPAISALKNDGIELKVYKTERYTEIDPDSGEEITRWRALTDKRDLKIRFTNAVMSDLELEFGNMDNWQRAIAEKPYSVVLSTFITVTGKPRDQVSEMLDSSTNEEYQVGLLIAWMIAMGASPDDLGKMLGSASKLGRAKDQLISGIVSMADQADELLAQSFPGENFSEPGLPVDEVSLPSGDIPQPKLSSSSEPVAATDPVAVKQGKRK